MCGILMTPVQPIHMWIHPLRKEITGQGIIEFQREIIERWI
jgi:hypothetical protein